jgi:hypothetical protein
MQCQAMHRPASFLPYDATAFVVQLALAEFQQGGLRNAFTARNNH